MQRLTPLPAGLHAQSACGLATALLGRLLVHAGPDGVSGGIIVETEAYLSRADPGCHAARGMTPRNAPMFGPPGRAYVYLVYGMHCCLNVVAAPEGVPEAVLIRALEPILGLDDMLRRRGVSSPRDCCSGPGKLCRALGVGLEHNGADLTRPPLFIADPPGGYSAPEPGEIVTATRIGLRPGAGDDLPLRYYLKSSPYVSRR